MVPITPNPSPVLTTYDQQPPTSNKPKLKKDQHHHLALTPPCFGQDGRLRKKSNRSFEKFLFQAFFTKSSWNETM
jgi:hypothetical protein